MFVGLDLLFLLAVVEIPHSQGFVVGRRIKIFACRVDSEAANPGVVPGENGELVAIGAIVQTDGFVAAG